MMRPATLVILLGTPWLLGACGGSASETPPPVEPPVERLRMDEEQPASDEPQNEPDHSKPE